MSYRTNNRAFAHEKIDKLSHPTPYFLFDEKRIINNLADYRQYLPNGTEICYAMKANSEKEVLELLLKAGSSFEVASTYELAMLKSLDVSPQRIIFGTSVKPAAAIAEFYDYGVRRFAFDSKQELEKIAQQAPGSQVFARVLVSDKADSVFTMSEKFGTSLDHAIDLLAESSKLGVLPYGISFNVGSQARNVSAWANSLYEIAAALRQLLNRGTKLSVINLGGGFPFSYQDGDDIPNIQEIGASINKAKADLPYPIQFLAEPGRGLVADAFVLVVSVFAENKRPNGHWLYLDAGAYNALLETMSYQGSIKYRVQLVRQSDAAKKPFILTGPTGDSLDLIDSEVYLPQDVSVGDKLVISDTGAYSFTLATAFNGFPKPPVHAI